MALVQFGMGINAIVGSVDGTTIRQWKGLAILSGKNNNSKIRNQTQSKWNSNFLRLQRQWQSLSDLQKLNWTNYAIFHPRTNSLAQPYTLSGCNQFVSTNLFLQLINIPTILDAPTDFVVTSLIANYTVTYSFITKKITIAFNPSPTDNNLRHVIFISGPYSKGVLTPANNWKSNVFIHENTNSPFVSNRTLDSQFGQIQSGMKFFSYIIPIDIRSGQIYTKIKSDFII